MKEQQALLVMSDDKNAVVRREERLLTFEKVSGDIGRGKSRLKNRN
jgi:hypothetical protein